MVAAKASGEIIILNKQFITDATGDRGAGGLWGFRTLTVVGMVIVLFIASHIIRNQIQGSQSVNQPTVPNKTYQRVVALSPSIVEIIYELGLDDQLAGVSRYSNHPPEAAQKTEIGGYLDLNMEKMITLDPDCVILLAEQSELARRCNRLNIHTLMVDHNHTRGILESIQTIGNALGAGQEAAKATKAMQQRVKELTTSFKRAAAPPRVLVCISRDVAATRPEGVIAAGSAGFHRELIEMAGAVNAYQGPVAFPSLSREKLIGLDPDIIIDLVNTRTWAEFGEDHLLGSWKAFSELRAVQNQRVIMIHGDQHLIPGPRFPQTLEQFIRNIHP